MKRSVPVFFLFFISFFFCLPALAQTNAALAPLKEITVVLDDNYPPYIFRDLNGQLQGILADEWRLWEERTGIKTTLQGMDWDKAKTAMAEGKAQVIDSIFFTEERTRTLDYSIPYHSMDVSVFFNKDISGITDFNTLHGFTIAVKAGDACIDILKGQGINTLQEYPNYESIVRAAAEKKVKVFCIDNPPAFYFLYKMNLENEFRYTSPIYTGQFHRAVPKGRKDLLAVVEKGFAEISRKEYKNIEKKWLGSIIPASPYLTYIFYALGLFVVLGGVILLWNYFLRREVARKTDQINKMLSVLQESEAKLRLLADNLPGGIVYQIDAGEKGEERRFTYLSAGVQQLHGISIAEALNDPMTMYGQIIEEDRHLLAERETYALASMSPFSTDVRIKVPSDEIKWISLSSSPRRIANNRVIWDGIEIDITKRKEAEEALIKSYFILKSVMESPRNVVIFALDRQYRYIAFNENHRQTMKHIWGADIALGSSMLEYILNPEDNSKAKNNFDRALAGESFTTIEEYGDTALERRYYEDIYNPIIDESGGVMGLTLFLTDITDRKQSEKEHERLQAQLLQSQKMESVGRLAGGVAHDFNNMLSVIIGYSELALREMPSTDKLYFNLQEIRKAAKRSADLTRQLLAFASKQIVAPKLLDLNEVVEGILQLLRRLIGEDINLIWMPDSGILPIYMDPSQIDQILTNLCVNARDAIAGVGKIVIETHEVAFDECFRSNHPEVIPGEYVLLSVNDNGCGMDKETMDRLFEPFFTTKESGKGTGLGLATIYGIVKQNGGFIYVDSAPGQGATFRIYLPGHMAKTTSVHSETPVTSAASGHETILLVEDESAILDLGAQMLEGLGYRVLSASTPGEAMRLARDYAGDINLLITDVILPEMNGRDLAKAIIGLYPGIKRLFMSGYTGDIISHENTLDETVNFMQKPFSMEDLAAKVREAIDNRNRVRV